MPTEIERLEQINRRAAEWVARSDRGLTIAEEAALSDWLSGDPRRAGAYMRMSAVLAHATGSSSPLTVSGALATRRKLLVGGAVAASLAVAGLLFDVQRPARFDTRKGQKRVVTLHDGSIVTLNTATRLEVSFTQSRRLVRLKAGEALFDVAKDPARPFIVSAGSVQIRAVGTSFTVARATDKPVQVLVREGVVEIVGAGSPAPVRLFAHRRATLPVRGSDVKIERVKAIDVDRALAWQQGRLVFEGEALAAAAAEFSRYSDVLIVITDPRLASKGVAGVFDANDPVGFAQAAALSLGARTEIAEGEVRILP